MVIAHQMQPFSQEDFKHYLINLKTIYKLLKQPLNSTYYQVTKSTYQMYLLKINSKLRQYSIKLNISSQQIIFTNRCEDVEQSRETSAPKTEQSANQAVTSSTGKSRAQTKNRDSDA